MNKFLNPETIAAPIVPSYTHTVEVPANARWLAISGQLGVDPQGNISESVGEQSAQAFRNILGCLEAAGMDKSDLVKLNIYLTDSRYVADWRAARKEVLGDDTVPAATLVIVTGLAAPHFLVEIEAWAAKA